MGKKLFLAGLDAVALCASFFLSALWLGLGSPLPWTLLAVFLTVKGFFFLRAGLYHAILKFAGLPLAIEILKNSAYASLVCFFITHLPIPSPILQAREVPLGFFITDYLVSTLLVGLIRFAPRYFRESRNNPGSKRVLIYGSGELGEGVCRKMMRLPGEYHVVGFLDDSPDKIGKRLHNLPIFGPTDRLPSLLARERVAEVIIAIAALPGETIRNIIHECRRNGALCRIVPSFSDMLKKDISIKNIDIADLLKREPKDLDEAQITRFLKGRTVMISGAGGSIGSELARQCLRYGVKKLVLFDHSEFNLYQLQEQLAGASVPIRFCLLNALNEDLLAPIMAEERPNIFFHAAAYKHVPIVEDNPREGVINNVQGTITTTGMAEKYGVEKFVLISTDKAVRPTNVMGATKRIAELYIQNLDRKSRTEFLAVRFGNVLGSSGSVIPKFIEQINKGGPVTVTHPDVTRYFMLISEAVQLVLQAASIGHGGEIFILNMGKPVRIADMAEDLIFLAGREPHKDVEIRFTGLRPGEKLYEELLVDETEKKTQYENITIARATLVDWETLKKQIEGLLSAVMQNRREEIVRAILPIVPEYKPSALCQETSGEVIPFRRSQ